MGSWYVKDDRRRWAANPTQAVTLEADGWAPEVDDAGSPETAKKPKRKAARKTASHSNTAADADDEGSEQQ